MSNPVLRAKMKCNPIIRTHTANMGVPSSEEINMYAVHADADSPENALWSKYTPCGNLSLHISNPDAIGKIDPSKEYYIDLTPVE